MGVRVPLRQAVMKTTPSIRNPYAILAGKRKAGKIRPRKEKRQNGKNKQREYLSDSDQN
jgi:hypothetical protein